MLQKCRLCNKDKVLIKSHIVPEGFYESIYDEKRRVFLVSKSRNAFNTMQKGQREYLLCKECDSDLIGNKYDKYGIEVIRDGLHKKTITFRDQLIWTRLDYNRFKIFLLSVLWRAHIAQNYHRGITLDGEIESIIIESIKTGIAPPEDVIPIVGFALVDPQDGNRRCDEIITNGNTYTRLGQLNSKTYIIVFGGYAWTFIVPKAEEKDPQKECFLNELGVITLPTISIYEFTPLMENMENYNFATENFDRINRTPK